MRLRIRFRLACVGAVMLLFALVGSASAVTPGSGAWYWPTGTESFGGMSPWWASRGGGIRHLAQDMASPSGHAVYAVGAGRVLESMYIDGYGPGGSVGGAMLVLHRTATGIEFKALYGHLKGLRYDKGDTVAAGAVIGYVNGASPNHVHFGIHPGRAYPPDGNEFRGHTYDPDHAYGWVDPVAFLRRNPRVIPYQAPAVPVVASIATTLVPTGPVAAAGQVWWRQVSEEGTSTWSRRLVPGLAAVLASAEQTPPVHDAATYAITVDSRPGMTVRDVRPRISARALHATPAAGRSVVITGALRNAVGLPFKGARIVLERRSGAGWVAVRSAVTGLDGVYRLAFVPDRRTQLRVRFTPPRTYRSAASYSVVVAPHVSLSRPVMGSTPRRDRPFRVTSTLAPRHSADAVVEFQVDRKVAGVWRRYLAKRGALADVTGGSAVRAYPTCRRAGDYRVRVLAAEDDAHAVSCSAWTYFSVR